MTARPTPAARRPRPTRARTGDDTGMTLSELVVVMMIGSVVLALVAALSIGLTQGNAQNLARQGQVDQALSAMRWLSRSLGQAVPPGTLSQAMAGEAAVLEASGTELVFYSNIDNPSSEIGLMSIGELSVESLESHCRGFLTDRKGHASTRQGAFLLFGGLLNAAQFEEQV